MPKISLREWLEMARLSMGGAMFGAASSGVAGTYMSLDLSIKRDSICAAIGFALCFWILLNERKRLIAQKQKTSDELIPSEVAANEH